MDSIKDEIVQLEIENLIITSVANGFLGTEFKASFAASIPSLFEILVYKDFTSKVTRNVSSFMFSTPLILLVKSAVSLI